MGPSTITQALMKQKQENRLEMLEEARLPPVKMEEGAVKQGTQVVSRS